MNLELNTNIGCFFIGVIIATPLYGLTCAQIMYYVRGFPEDWIGLKSLPLGYRDVGHVASGPACDLVQGPYKIPLMAILAALSLVSGGRWIRAAVHCAGGGYPHHGHALLGPEKRDYRVDRCYQQATQGAVAQD
ncbi:predicted protein [Postia placenta Mad-698-R]|nr:predicted protein [Postia placenta Mad-698-R]